MLIRKIKCGDGEVSSRIYYGMEKVSLCDGSEVVVYGNSALISIEGISSDELTYIEREIALLTVQICSRRGKHTVDEDE